MSRNTLTDKQNKFLDLLFSDEYIDNPRGAATIAGYSSNTMVSQIIDSVKDEILRRSDQQLVLHAPKSVKKINDVLDNPHVPGAKTTLDASFGILDRVGISKRERLEVEHKAPSGIVIFPAKNN